jgi:hypothetical protein
VPAPSVVAAVLAAASVLLAGPISAVLARARWTRRAPRAALVLWQALCLSAGICLVGAGFTVALAPYGPNMAVAGWTWLGDLGHGHPLARMSGAGIVAGTLASSAALILFGVLVRSVVLAVRRRRAHRLLLDLLTGKRAGAAPAPDAAKQPGCPQVPRTAAASVLDELLTDVRILDHPTAVAYTCPAGIRGWSSPPAC